MVRLLFTLISTILCVGCTRSNVDSFTDPSLGNSNIRSIAIFPLRNARTSASEAIEIDRKVSEALHRRDPSLKIMGPAESGAAVNSSGL
jgi:hypothetical protein